MSWRWSLAALSALLMVAAFPIAGPVPVWRTLFAWIAIAPLSLAVLLRDKSGRIPTSGQSALLGYFSGILWYAGNCYWVEPTMHLYGGISSPASIAILIGFCFYCGLYTALYAWTLRAIAREGSDRHIARAVLVSPFLWVAVELARSRILGLPWDELGGSQVSNLQLTWLAPIGGVYMLSFVLAGVSAIIVARVALPRTQSRQIGLLVSLFIFFIVIITGTVIAARTPPSRPDEFAVLLQQNLDVASSNEWNPQQFEQNTGLFTHLSIAAASSPNNPGQSASLIVWPESPAPFRSDDPRFAQLAAQLATATNAPLILGNIGISRDPSSPTGALSMYNSAAFVTPDGTISGRYDKIHLVPFGEFIPFKNLLSFAHTLTQEAGDFDRGTRRLVFSSGGHRYGVFICYESTFPDEVRQFALNGAEVLVNISNDGWYGDTSAPWQHLDQARMRAIENRRWILRDTNTGVTASIDPEGRIVTAGTRHRLLALRAPFAFRSDTTFYTRHGDWFAYLCAIISIAALAAPVLARNRS
jgi:apolipoprotein N-acyltransferase